MIFMEKQIPVVLGIYRPGAMVATAGCRWIFRIPQPPSLLAG